MREKLLQVVCLLLLTTSACASSQENDPSAGAVPGLATGRDLLPTAEISNDQHTAVNLGGRFVYTHDIQMNYPSAAKCKQAGGRWVTGRDHISRCLFAIEDEVNVIPQKNSFLISITVSGNNAHQCDFEGSGRQLAANVIEAEDTTTANCKLQVRYLTSDKIAVTEKSACACPEGTMFNLEAQRAP